MAKFGGAITALVTPMHEDESVDYEGFRTLVKRQLEGGIDGILPLGTTAETPTLTEDEEDEKSAKKDKKKKKKDDVEEADIEEE